MFGLYLALFERRQDAYDVFGLFERRPAGRTHGRAHLARDERGQRGFS